MSVTKALDLVGSAPGGRKLVAVVYADMVGYSRLIGLDDIGTLERLRTLRTSLIDRAINEHGGKIVQTGGDSLLVVFDSIDGAVRCAIAIQRQVPSYNCDQPPDRAIQFRVGINIGDVIADGTDLHGDGVNVAVRLQAQCPPGGICVTRAIRDHIHGRLNLCFEELGALSLKNIPRPVEAFVMTSECGHAPPKSIEQSLVLAPTDALPPPDKPSIAVLPFANLSDDPGQQYFVEGITEDITTELSRFRATFVIARNSTFAYAGKSVDVRQVGRELSVHYIVTGSVRRAGDRVRVNAQLIDADTGNQLWAERYDRTIEDVFSVQEDITRGIVMAVAPEVELAEATHSRSGSVNDNAERLAWQARRLYIEGVHTGHSGPMLEAISTARRAIDADPLSLHAHSVLVNSYWHCHLFRWGPDPAKLVNTMWAVVEAMQRIDALDYRTLTYSGVVRIVRGELQRGVADLRRALEVNPNVTVTLMWLSWAEVAAGLGKEAEEHALLAIRISPRDHRITNSYVVLAMVSYSACKFTEAAQWAAMAIQSRPATVIARAIMIACNARAGDLSEAARERAALVEFAPDFICSLFRGESPIFKRPEDLDRLLDGLRLAGCGERCQ